MPNKFASSSVPLSSLHNIGDSHKQARSSLLPPNHSPDLASSTAGSSDFEHISKDHSRQPTPASELPHPDHFDPHDGDGESDFGAWDEDEEEDIGVGAADPQYGMPSDLRPSMEAPHVSHSQPLLGGDKQHEYESPSEFSGHESRRSTRFRQRDADEAAKAATRKRYTFAAIFLGISLVSFAVQTETAVYIQHNLGWAKPYCMLYFTHGSWSLLWPAQLLMLRIQKWNQPWPQFWRRHVQLLRQTGQMIEHRTLHVPSNLQHKSPVPYFVYTTAYVTTALTIAGGSWYVAVNLTTASDLTAIYNCSAFFAYAFAVPLLNEKLRWDKIVAVGVAIVGVLVVAYGDSGTPKHGSKSGGGSGGAHAPDDSEAKNRVLGNIVIGIGSVLYGFYEVLYKRVACPPDGTSPGRGASFAATFGSMMGVFTLCVLWIPLPIFHYLGIETFELPTGKTAWILLISVLANATFSGCFLVLISLTSPVLSSVAALLTIFIVALCDQMLPPPLYSPLTGAAIFGGLLIIGAFLLLAWATYREMQDERKKHADDIVPESDVDEV